MTIEPVTQPFTLTDLQEIKIDDDGIAFVGFEPETTVLTKWQLQGRQFVQLWSKPLPCMTSFVEWEMTDNYWVGK